MATIFAARIITILGMSALLACAGCDGAAPEQSDGATQPSRELRLGLGYSIDDDGGKTSYIITIDLLGPPNTTYDVQVYKASSQPGRAVEITTNDRGVGAGTKRVTRPGSYQAVVIDPGGNIVARDVLEVG